MLFCIIGLFVQFFVYFFGFDDVEFVCYGVLWLVIVEGDCYFDCIELCLVWLGEVVLFVNYEYQGVDMFYCLCYVIFVCEYVGVSFDVVDCVLVMLCSLMLLCVFDVQGMMVDVDIVEGEVVEGFIECLFGQFEVVYFYVYYVCCGCYVVLIWCV